MTQGKNISTEDMDRALKSSQAEAATLLERQRSHSTASTSAKRDMPSITADPAAYHNISRFDPEQSSGQHCTQTQSPTEYMMSVRLLMS